RLHRLAVHVTDDIATLQASALRRAAWLDSDDHGARPLRQASLTGHLRGDILELQAPLARRLLTRLLADGSLGWQFANRHGYFLRLPIATQDDHHVLSHRGPGYHRPQVMAIFYWLGVTPPPPHPPPN